MRISKLIDSGIVVRKRGKYHLTSFGKIVYEAQKQIERAVENRWKLAAIDSVELSSLFSNPKLPAEERNRIIDTLMEGNDDIKEILLRGIGSVEMKKRTKKGVISPPYELCRHTNNANTKDCEIKFGRRVIIKIVCFVS